MHNAMADRACLQAQLLAQPCASGVQCRRDVGNGRTVIFSIDKVLSVWPARPQMGTRADPVHLAFDSARELRGIFQRQKPGT